MIKNGGVYKNNVKVSDPELEISKDDLIDGRLLLLAAGKKNKLLVRIIQ
jgi:tyrosyl-tRNA synthetase